MDYFKQYADRSQAIRMRINFTFLFVLGGFFFLFSAHAQVSPMDKVEMLYDQGNYKKANKKAEKLFTHSDPNIQNSAKLFALLSEFQEAHKAQKISSSSLIFDYEKLMETPEFEYLKSKYEIYIYDFQMGLSNEIRWLNKNGNTNLAHIRYNSFVRLFKTTSAFETLTKENVTVKPTISTNRLALADHAKKQLGVDYKFGGIDEDGFDCSGFTQFVYSNAGLSLPRTAAEQSKKATRITLEEAEQGDLLFFGSSEKNISHVGMVISPKGQPTEMIHASSSKGIMISKIESDAYWQSKFQFAGRIIND